MTLLPDLEARLDAAARRTQPASVRARARRGLRPRRRTLVIALAVALLLGSVAVAAVRITRAGDPAPRRTGLGSPYLGPGRVLPGQTGVLAARADDPDGGLPWGLRVYETSRRAACWQVGRVLDGRLGVLGRDGILGDDGLFHELALQVDQCRPVDGAGHLFLLQNALALDNGVTDRLSCRPADWQQDGRHLPICPPGSARLVLYGFLGPLARTVTIDGDGVERKTVRTGAQGAFLFPIKLKDMAQSPRYALTATYADGTSRPVEDVAPVESVPQPAPPVAHPPGWVDPLRDLARPARVRAPLHVTHRRLAKNTIYTIGFRAPVAVHRYGVEYSVLVDGPAHGSGPTCGAPMRFQGFNTTGDIAAGQRVAIKLTPGVALRYDHGWCPGDYRVTVILHDREHPVGTFRFSAGGSGSP